jgi:class 3 adenylate cyclase
LENARFCHGCGSPVNDGDTRAEYKQVTVLFADVVHSMDIAAVVGPERLREIITDLVDRCGAVVQRYGGTVAMAGLVMEHVFQDRVREASQLASEAMALIESIGDPTLTVGLSPLAIYAKTQFAEFCDLLQWSQRVIDLADGDPSRGNLLFGSPLAFALAQRGLARYCLGRPGWRDDLRHGVTMARGVADPVSYAVVVCYAYNPGIPLGVLTADDSAMREIENALRIAERSGDDFALAVARMTLGVALVHRQTATDRDRGQELLAEVNDVFVGQGQNLCDVPMVTVYVARERARRGDRDEAIPVMRAAIDHVFREGHLLLWGVAPTGVLVETLLNRGANGDVAEAEGAIERLAAAPTDDGLPMRDIWLLRLHALLARAHGDAAAYADFRDRYRDMAKSLEFEGHIAWAEAMP